MFIRFAGALLALGLSCAGCGSSAPITLRPTLTNAKIGCPADKQMLHPGKVVDRRGYHDTANVGFTQTGMSNVKASLLTEPPPTGLVRARLENVLRGCGGTSDGEPVRIDVLITRFQTTEETGFSSETITAEIALNVRALGADGKPLGTFDVSADAEESAMDTTDSAQLVIERALTKIEELLARGLVSLARTLPGRATATASSGKPMSARIKAEARFVHSEIEDDVFDERLIDAGLVPIELMVELRQSGDPISIRRDGVSALFSGGRSITALDSRKTQELVRAFAAFVPFGQGTSRYAAGQAADDEASEQAGGRAAVEVTHVETVGDKLDGMMFFQSPTMPRATPESVAIELVDSHTGAVEKIVLRVGQARPGLAWSTDLR